MNEMPPIGTSASDEKILRFDTAKREKINLKNFLRLNKLLSIDQILRMNVFDPI